MAHKWKRRVST